MLTVVSVLLLILNNKKIITLKSQPIIAILYLVIVAGVIYVALSLFGSPLSNKINEYQQGVLQESEEECKQDNAPIWCNL